MDGEGRKKRIPHILYEYANAKQFLNLYGLLNLGRGKIRFEIANHSGGRHTDRAVVQIPLDDWAVIMPMILNGQFARYPFPGAPENVLGEYSAFSGSPVVKYEQGRKTEMIESRQFKLAWAPDKEPGDGAFRRLPWQIILSQGPGKKMATGAVVPDGKPTTVLRIRISDMDMRKIVTRCMREINAWSIVTYKDRRRADEAALMQKMHMTSDDVLPSDYLSPWAEKAGSHDQEFAQPENGSPE